METIEGTLEHIIFQNEENGYTVAKLIENGKANPVTIVGNVMGLQLGEIVVCQGYWYNDKRFGQQFVIEAFEIKTPTTTRGIQMYLASGAVAGIGDVLAKRIVDYFGEKSLEIFDVSIQRLTEIEGIGKKKLERIQVSWAQQKDVRQVMIFLQNHGISPAFAQRIFKTYKQKSIEKVKENPYRLSTEIDGIGFKKSDAIAQKMGIAADSALRVEAGISYALEQASLHGHSCYPLEGLVQEAAELLGVATELVQTVLHQLLASKKLLFKILPDIDNLPQTFVWSKINFQYEKDIVAEVRRLLLFKDKLAEVSWEIAIENSCKKHQITLAEQQENAVSKSIQSKFHIITGGPGTGKSTITKIILDICKSYDTKIILAAPTGRAAKRLSEITQQEASTIHILLTYDFANRCFRKNQNDQLEADVIIIDEASMIDAFLMSALLKAIPDKCKIILVGDVNQLPSVGAGNVLGDLIQSEQVPVTKLTEIFRQASNSQIVINAHKINQGVFPNIQIEKDSDFFFISERQPERLIQHVLGLIENRLPKAYNFHKLKDIQLLCPMNKGPLGSIEFNKFLQLHLNPKKINEEEGIGHRKFVEGDKVIQTRNNYDKEVFNGDIGFITKIQEIDKLLLVKFDNKEVEYEFSELLDLELAYAVSVHKYQGSESPCIIMPIHETYSRLLFRNLVYTGITRGKRLVVLLGTKEALNIAIQNNKSNLRFTGLVSLLQQNERQLPPIQIVPMLGSEGYAEWVNQFENLKI